MQIRPIEPRDYPKVEELIKAAILEVNSKNYAPEVIDHMTEVDPYQPRNMASERDYFVAVEEDVSGVVGLSKNEVKTLFVDPRFHGRGVGSLLLKHVENIIKQKGLEGAVVYSSVSAKGFYEKNGYRVVREDESEAGSGIMIRYYMEKNFKDTTQ